MIMRYKKTKEKKKKRNKRRLYCCDYDYTKIYKVLGLCERGHKRHYFFNTLKKQSNIVVKIMHSSYFKKHLSTENDLTVIFNFIHNNEKTINQCKNPIFAEVGFFPHYRSFIFDPLGFCWESSLTQMKFEKCSNRQRKITKKIIEQFDIFEDELHPKIKKPFFLWPDQLLWDNTNKCGLNLKKWSILINHFRQCLPDDIQLVIKIHPRSTYNKHSYLYKLPDVLKNTIVMKDVSLSSLLTHCVGVAGANSTVLYESRLIYNKPTYVYAKSWFTNHEQIFYPINYTNKPQQITIFDSKEVDKNYLRWFLYQLIIRRILISDCKNDKMIKKMLFLCKNHFTKYGEEIFE